MRAGVVETVVPEVQVDHVEVVVRPDREGGRYHARSRRAADPDRLAPALPTVVRAHEDDRVSGL
jgi:hypothetical protein